MFAKKLQLFCKTIFNVNQNAIYNSGFKYAQSTQASYFRLNGGEHQFLDVPALRPDGDGSGLGPGGPPQHGGPDTAAARIPPRGEHDLR